MTATTETETETETNNNKGTTMPINLEEPETEHEQLPVLKVPDVGDTITGAIIDTATIDVRNFDTGEVETFDDGNPKKQKVITLLVTEATGGAKARLDGVDIPAPIGEQATIFTGFAGYYAHREGVAGLGRAVQVGDLLTWATDREEPPKRKGFNPFKVRTYVFTGNLDAAQIAAAEAAHLARKERIDIEEDANTGPGTEPF